MAMQRAASLASPMHHKHLQPCTLCIRSHLCQAGAAGCSALAFQDTSTEGLGQGRMLQGRPHGSHPTEVHASLAAP